MLAIPAILDKIGYDAGGIGFGVKPITVGYFLIRLDVFGYYVSAAVFVIHFIYPSPDFCRSGRRLIFPNIHSMCLKYVQSSDNV